jgi:hypothetical protein
MASEALIEALRHVWRTLSSLQVPAALMGGIAMAAWKHVPEMPFPPSGRRT